MTRFRGQIEKCQAKAAVAVTGTGWVTAGPSLNGATGGRPASIRDRKAKLKTILVATSARSGLCDDVIAERFRGLL
jgi:hypothetical protein